MQYDIEKQLRLSKTCTPAVVYSGQTPTASRGCKPYKSNLYNKYTGFVDAIYKYKEITKSMSLSLTTQNKFDQFFFIDILSKKEKYPSIWFFFEKKTNTTDAMNYKKVTSTIEKIRELTNNKIPDNKIPDKNITRKLNKITTNKLKAATKAKNPTTQANITAVKKQTNIIQSLINNTY